MRAKPTMSCTGQPASFPSLHRRPPTGHDVKVYLLIGLLALSTIAATPSISSPAASPTTMPAPPEQPQEGPGGSTLPHAAVTAHRYGKDGSEFWIYEPARPAPSSAPVIVFLHGWSATTPATYGAWINHLVRRGNIVIYPRYQADLTTPAVDFTPNALAAVQDALARLELEKGHVAAERDHFALVGHSMGGVLAANLAAQAKTAHLPTPKAILSIEPGITNNPFPRASVPLADLSQIPADTLLLAVVGEEDQFVGDADAKRIFRESTQIPLTNKNYITLRSDYHGRPPLLAGHLAPLCGDQPEASAEVISRARHILSSAVRPRLQQDRTATTSPVARRAATRPASATGLPPEELPNMFITDALDYYGLWKLFDGLTDAAFYQKNRNIALGDTPEQRFMGRWSDGTPVKELTVTTKP